MQGEYVVMEPRLERAPEEPRGERSAGRARPRLRAALDTRAALVVVVALGIGVRAWHVLTEDFPLNDGGMFFQMTRDLQRAHFLLPAWTSYNAAGIPYGYSPLGFYLAAALDTLTPLDLTQVFRWLPLAVASLTILAFLGLARRLLPSRPHVVIAVAAFGLLPRSFIWLIMGGGVTRSLGFLFALLTLTQLHRLYADRNRRAIALAALCAGLTLLSHLGTAPFTAASALLLLLAYGRHRLALAGSVAAAVGALLVAAPWWASVVAAHGLGPFQAASATGGWVFSGLSGAAIVRTLAQSGLGTGEPMLAVIGMLAALGFFAALAGGTWFLPAWWLLITAVDTRQGATFATAPIAMLAAIGVLELLLPVLRRRSHQGGALRRRAPEFALGGLALFAVVGALLRTPAAAIGLGDLATLSPPERQAMRWVAHKTPANARVLVVANLPWQVDRTSEWLPVLGRRVTVATVQGTEWLPDHAFRRRETEFNALQVCAQREAVCLDRWAQATGRAFTHVYVPRSSAGVCCVTLVASLDRDRRYRRVFDGPGAVIFERRAATARPATDAPATAETTTPGRDTTTVAPAATRAAADGRHPSRARHLARLLAARRGTE
ncbi:MAG TPA: hypothetical protein VFS40_16220 [Gemmatimonadales bacterium]|nr:hypothetical protein [Gemmatimonadales bacterium]